MDISLIAWLVHFKLGNLDLAVAFLEQATILEPVDPVISDHLGDAYWATGRFVEARYKWQYALSITDDDDLKANLTAKLTMINVIAPAKLIIPPNLWENDNGYHLFDSLVAFTEFGDNLTISPAEKDELFLTGEFAGKINTHKKQLNNTRPKGLSPKWGYHKSITYCA